MQRHPIYTSFHWPEFCFKFDTVYRKLFSVQLGRELGHVSQQTDNKKEQIIRIADTTKTRVSYEVMYVFVVFSFATYFAFVKVLAGICRSSEHIL